MKAGEMYLAGVIPMTMFSAKADNVGPCNLAPWPLSPLPLASLESEQLEKIETLTNKIFVDEPNLFMQSVFGDNVHCGWVPAPTLYLEDHREIDLVTETDAQHYEYRTLTLARDNDFLLIARTRVPDFETYLKTTVNLGSPKILPLPIDLVNQMRSLAMACKEHSESMDILVSAAKVAGALNIMPFISSEAVWLLADTIAKAAEVPVYVSAAFPRMSKHANDKLWMAEQIATLLGRDSLPPYSESFDIDAAVARLHFLAKKSAHIVFKTPSSAGARGNVVFQSADIKEMNREQLLAYVLDTLHAIGWSDHYPLLVGVWEESVLSSPSAQLWIPLVKNSEPLLEGVFVQKLNGSRGKFSGAERVKLPYQLQLQFTQEALMLGTLLQSLGYFGRVSFDALLVGESIETAQLHWIECNARWGGVSIPMTLANRLGASTDSSFYVIVQNTLDEPIQCSFLDVLKQCRHVLFDEQKTKQGIIFLSPVGQGETAAIFLAIGSNKKNAEKIAQEARNILANISRMTL